MARDPYTDGSGGWPVPILDRGMTFRDVGSSGLRQFGGYLREEFLPQLAGRQASRVYREMADNNATVGSVLFAITQAMRKVEWRVNPPSDKPEAKAEAEFVESLMDDMSHTWGDHQAETFSMLPFGYAPCEIVYKRRLGRSPPKARDDDSPGKSAFDDGRIGWRRLPLRGQETVIKWFFSPNGQIKGLTQQPWIGALIDLPIEKLLLFRPGAHKSNPEGRSILRNAYQSYYFIKRLQEQEAILFERLSGFPLMRVPSALIEAAQAVDNNGKPTQPDAMRAYDAYKKMVTNMRIGEQMGAVIPSDLFMDQDGKPTSARMYDFELLTPQHGRSSVDPDKTIERYKLDILMTVLCDFIKMGHEVRGTNNLAVTKADMFYQAIGTWLNSNADVYNRYALPRLWDLNGLDPDIMPQIEPDMAQRLDLDSLGVFIGNLASAGMPLFPDEDLEAFLRDAAGLPDADDTGAYRAAQGNTDVLKRIMLGSMARRMKQIKGRPVTA